jgi:hypothetical protein
MNFYSAVFLTARVDHLKRLCCRCRSAVRFLVWRCIHDNQYVQCSGWLVVKTGVFAGSHGTRTSIVVGNIQGS